MSAPQVSLDTGLSALLGADVVAALAAAALGGAGVGFWCALVGGLVIAVLACVVRIGDAVGWRWGRRVWRLVGRRGARTLMGERALADGEHTVSLPTGAQRTVGSRALAAAVAGVLEGGSVRRSYSKAGLAVTPAAGSDAVLAAELVVGDIGHFADSQILALGEGECYVDGEVVDIDDIDTSAADFLGWSHPSIPGVPVNVADPDGNHVGVLREATTVITMIEVWGRAYMPTVLHPHRAETPNMLPLTVIAENMQRLGLNVDVDVIVEGQRVSGDPYAVQYDRHVGERAAAGQRSAILVIRLDTHSLDTIEGLVWRGSTADAVIAATRRIEVALQRSGCRVKILEAHQMLPAALAAVGGQRALADGFEVGWKELRQRGRGYLTSFYLRASDITAENLDQVWAYTADAARPVTHSTLVIALRRHQGEVRASALVRMLSTHPLVRPPTPHLHRATGWQWEALLATMIGAARLRGLPDVAVTAELDSAIIVGPSGIMLGGVGEDAWLLMPLSDPAQPTRIAVHTDTDLVVRQLIRRAAAVGERVAVYDSARRWVMSAASPYIWNTADSLASPPWTPTLIVHNGEVNPYPDARSAVTVGKPRPSVNGDRLSEADIELDVDTDGRSMVLRTKRFDVPLVAVTIRNEQPYLN